MEKLKSGKPKRNCCSLYELGKKIWEKIRKSLKVDVAEVTRKQIRCFLNRKKKLNILASELKP